MGKIKGPREKEQAPHTAFPQWPVAPACPVLQSSPARACLDSSAVSACTAARGQALLSPDSKHACTQDRTSSMRSRRLPSCSSACCWPSLADSTACTHASVMVVAQGHTHVARTILHPYLTQGVHAGDLGLVVCRSLLASVLQHERGVLLASLACQQQLHSQKQSVSWQGLHSQARTASTWSRRAA